MERKLIPLALALTLTSAARAADVYTPIPLTPGSFNADVVVEKTAAPPIEGYITAGPDGGTNLTGNAWFESGYYPSRPYWGLPRHGSTFAAQYFPDGTLGPDTNHVYQMPPDYTTNNALFVSANNGPRTATLTFVNPAAYAGLSVFNSSGNGGETINYTVHHADGSTETGTFVSTDWWHGNGSAPFPAWMAHCLVSAEGNNLQQIDGNNGSVYYNDIPLTTPGGVANTSPVTSIDFALNGTGGRMNVFAISGTTDGVAYTNCLALAGFNQDMVVEASAPNFSMNVTACTATMERGTNLWGRVYMEKGFAGQNASYGLPPAGSTFTSPDNSHSFTLAPDYTKPNTLLVAGTNSGPNGGTFAVKTPAAYQALSLLGGSTWGPRYVDVTVHHADTSVEVFSAVGIEDWWHNGNRANNGYQNTLALMTEAAFQVDNLAFDIGGANHEELYAIDIPLGNQTSPVTSVEITYNSTFAGDATQTGVTFFMGLAGKTGSSTPAYQPVLVTGYNADMIVEKAAVFRPHGLYNATTVSMDGGTNNTGATWYEQGYYKQFPNTGLPPAGSIVHSVAQANSYQMPASYTANNAAYIDATHPTANLAPAAAAAYTALSFLSSDANGWVSNRVVMQYQDGTSDTNYFVSQDWFYNGPYAYTSLGRVNLDSPAINNDPGHTTTPNPRLFEAQVGLKNTTSPLTNVALTFLQGSGASSRMVVMAVSGAVSSYPVIISGLTQSTNAATMEGVVLSFAATIAGGAEPITYHWQVQSNNVWVNLADGVAGVSGASTPTATIATYAGWMTNAGSPNNGGCNFRLQAANDIATVYSGIATVTLRSGYPDLPMPGDTVSGFGASTADAGPAGNIDHLVGGNPDVKCLWTANANVGFITTPSVGSSIARALRLYWANDSDVRDPATVILEGSNDGGTTWNTILAQTSVTHNTTRNSAASVAPNPFTQAMQEFDFYGNNAAYTSYRVTFPTVYSTSGNNLTQIGEVEILGQSLNTAPPFFTVQPPPAQKVYAGASPTFTVAAGGAPTLHYQWYSNNVAIPGATAATFKLANARLNNSGNTFYCQVSNPNGTTNSAVDTLTVLSAPTQAYPVAVLADRPLAFYRLDEGPDNYMGNNGVVANDYAGGFCGTYSNATLAVQGYNPSLDADTATLFGQANSDSMVDNIPLSFAAPAGQNVAFSVEAWVRGSAAQTSDAGILTIGYGGFEQLNLDCGGANHAFRFYVRDASGGTHGPGGTQSADDLRWHHVVGVCDEANSNVVLYVDGVQNAITKGFNSGLGILGPTTPLTIGARRQSTTTDYNYQFLGSIDEVAIYNSALTATQVLAHYYAANPPPVFAAQPTNTIVGEGATLKLYSAAYGPGTLSYQWYQTTDYGTTWSLLSGQTSSNLTLANISAALDQAYFVVVASNPYGSITSSITGMPGAQVSVRSGPPVIDQDVPSAQLAVAGSTLTLQVVAYGTPPLSYQWQSSSDNGATWVNLANDARISGVTSNILTIGNVRLSDGLVYRVSILNSKSGGYPTTGGSDYVTVMPSIGFNSNGLGWQFQGTGINNEPPQPSLIDGVLTLTDGGSSENASAYFTNQVYVGAPFRVSFTYQATGIQGSMADGACFVIHNDPRGPAVLSGGGGTFGISGVTPSAELEFNLYPGAHGGTGFAFNVNGNNGNVLTPDNPTGTNLATAPVVLDSGHHINVVLTYYGAGLLQVNLTEQETGATWSTWVNTLSLPGGADLPTLVGADTTGGYAWVGFSGADGGSVSYQRISNFNMISLPTLSAHATSANSILISWPAPQVGGYVLQSKSDLTSGTWQNVTAPVSLLNGQYQVTLPSANQAFYRLVLP